MTQKGRNRQQIENKQEAGKWKQAATNTSSSVGSKHKDTTRSSLNRF